MYQFGDKRWPFETPYPPLLEDLTGIAFIYFRKFLQVWLGTGGAVRE